jgi:PAS domain S-box-containing protein
MTPPEASPGAARPADGSPADDARVLQRAYTAFSRWLSEEREHIGDRRFWVVQGLVLVLAGLHAIAEGMFQYHVRLGHASHALYFIPEAFFLIPVGYAALNFGLRGSVLTALWCTLLAVPNLLTWHYGEQITGTVLQLVILNVMAIFVGQRVDREVRARRQAEAAGLALRASEARYRALFQTSGEAALVFDVAGVIRDANAAAIDLFGHASRDVHGGKLLDLLGAANASKLAAAENGGSVEIVHKAPDGRATYLQAVSTVLPQGEGEALVQVLLRDVTRERERREELRTYASHIVRAQEEERRRAGQELHDDVLQSLVILLRQLDGVEDKFAEAGPAPVGELRCARTKTEEIIATVRGFAHRLRPPWLEDLGIAASLRRIVRDAGARSRLEAELRVDGEERRLPMDVELGLFRIAQEAIFNVERHASAKSLSVTLCFRPDGVEMRITDDGVGFDREAGRAKRLEHGNLGIVGMEERAALLGGSFRLDSTLGRGTTVSVSVARAAPS